MSVRQWDTQPYGRNTSSRFLSLCFIHHFSFQFNIVQWECTHLCRYLEEKKPDEYQINLIFWSFIFLGEKTAQKTAWCVLSFRKDICKQLFFGLTGKHAEWEHMIPINISMHIVDGFQQLSKRCLVTPCGLLWKSQLVTKAWLCGVVDTIWDKWTLSPSWSALISNNVANVLTFCNTISKHSWTEMILVGLTKMCLRVCGEERFFSTIRRNRLVKHVWI